MVSKRCRALLNFPFFLLIVFSGGWQVCGQQTKHDTPGYDEGGTFKITLDIPMVQQVKISGEIDAFIWDHWSQHRRGKLQIISQTIEGQITFQRIFIDHDPKGSWCVRDELEADVHKGVYPPKPQTRIDEYDEVRRVDSKTGLSIPASQKRAIGTYKLLLLNGLKRVQRVF